MSRALIIAGFSLIGVLFVIVEVLGRQHRWKLVGFAEIATGLLRRRSIRIAVAVFWWWVGWHFLMT